MEPQERTEQQNHRKNRSSSLQEDRLLQHGKLPPQAVDIEEVVLGGLMLERRAMETASKIIDIGVFYKESHQRIYAAIKRLYDGDLPVDILTVTNELRHTNDIELAGGPFYITQLTSRVASSANIEHHCAILLQKFFKREMIKIGTDMIRLSFEDDSDAIDVLDKSDQQFAEMNEMLARGGNMNHIAVIGDKAEEALKRREKLAKENKTTGVPTGLQALNKLTGGWQPSDLIIIGGRPGMGKTAVSLKFVKSAAESGTPVCMYSLEMQDTSLYDRLALSCADIDVNRFRSGYMSKEDWVEFYKAKAYLSKLPIYVDDNPMVSMRYIKGHSKTMNRKGKCGMIVVDYLQLADMRSDEKGRNREQEVTKASRDAKIIAKLLHIPFILLSQLNRAVDARGNHSKKPQLSDLRESGAIEQDADMVIFIYRPWMYGINEDDTGTSTEGVGVLIIAKHRNGALDEVFFEHNTSLTKIYDFNANKGVDYEGPRAAMNAVIDEARFTPLPANLSFLDTDAESTLGPLNF
ncbi:replicative DNA helicase [bacterium]|jgi:replicative DNA helicase|nr:replicative DNA helicase [bacterium]